VASGLHVTGRIVLNLWRILRSDMALNIYTFENVVFKVLHQRYPDHSCGSWAAGPVINPALSLSAFSADTIASVPLYSASTLTAYWTASRRTRGRVLRYYTDRVQKTIELADELDVIGRTRCVLATYLLHGQILVH